MLFKIGFSCIKATCVTNTLVHKKTLFKKLKIYFNWIIGNPSVYFTVVKLSVSN